MAKTQWHPAFCAAMRLELRDIPTLQFINEFNLTEKPLEVDMLIINKPSDVKISNGIGEFFKGHNLVEYKSPTDHSFNEFSVCQMLSYAYYYCTRYQTWDVTLTLIASKENFNILDWLASQGMEYSSRHPGIYTLHGISFLEVQIVITEEIDGELFQWLSSLTDKLTEEKARKLVITAYHFTENEDKRLAEAVVKVLTTANEGLFRRMREDDSMASALMELMKPEVEKYAQEYAEKYAEEYAQKSTKKYAQKCARAMIKHGDDNEYIKFIMEMTDEEIDSLRKEMQQ